MKKQFLTLIPFDGFYESHAMGAIEYQIENDQEYYEEQGTPIGPNEAKIDFQKFAQLVPDLYKTWLDQEHDIKLDSLTFESLESPRLYNCGTDLIYCHTSKKDILKLYVLFIEDEDEAQNRINERFKSRSGFASFYSDFVSEWKTKPISNWDHNELSILFPTPDWSFFYDDADCNGGVSGCITYPEVEPLRPVRFKLPKVLAASFRSGDLTNEEFRIAEKYISGKWLDLIDPI